MILAFALTISVLFGCGAYLLLHRDLIRVTAGVALISQSAVLTLLASSLGRGQAPLLPVDEQRTVSDPLTQAMALTALVIGLATTGLLVALVERVTAAHRDTGGDPALEPAPDAELDTGADPQRDALTDLRTDPS